MIFSFVAFEIAESRSGSGCVLPGVVEPDCQLLGLLGCAGHAGSSSVRREGMPLDSGIFTATTASTPGGRTLSSATDGRRHGTP
jgi:hypothetical protein